MAVPKYDCMAQLTMVEILNVADRDRRARPIAHQEAFEQLHDKVKEIESEDLTVQSWQVPREFNADADGLANNALDEWGASDNESNY
jgi:hypothetical protein